MGNCLGSSDGSTAEGERELARRREALIYRNRLEQQQWRERRLRDVVRLLVDRGEATEGAPLAFQLPDKPEVAARRCVRNTRRMTAQARLQMDLAIAATEEEENARYDADTLKIIRTPLEELLANGRPPDCLPAPDVMQLLLEGKEVEVSSTEDEEDMTTATDVADEETPTQPHWSPDGATTTTDGLSRRDDFTSQANTIANACPNTNAPTTHVSTPSVPETADERARRAARNKKEEAILRELHHEQHLQRRRRRTAEEVYGKGVEYTPNRYNSLYNDEMLNSPLTARSVRHRQQKSSTSRLMELLTPLSPSRNKRKKAGADGDQSKSAFDDRIPAGSMSMKRYSIHEDGMNANRIITDRSYNAEDFLSTSMNQTNMSSVNNSPKLDLSMRRRRTEPF